MYAGHVSLGLTTNWLGLVMMIPLILMSIVGTSVLDQERYDHSVYHSCLGVKR